MMYWIVNWSVKFRRIVLPVAVGLLIFGFLQLDGAKQDILPEFSPTIVEVQTEALGLSAAEVERLITTPLEQDLLNGVAFLETIESASLPGLSSVVMEFESGTDLLDARQVVAERLTQAAGLPQVANPPQMIQPLSSASRVAMVSLDSSELSPIEISVLARWVMVPRLLGVEGVANVSIWGFRDQQLQVLVDPSELAANNVSLSQVIATAGNALEVSPLSFLEASTPGTGGFIDTVNQRLHVFHEQTISTPEELAQVTVEGPEGGAVFIGGEPLALGDVTEIVADHQPLIGDAHCVGGPCVLLVVEKFPDANTPQVARDVSTALAALSLGLPGMEIDQSIYQPASFIEASVANLRTVLVISAILLLLVLIAFFVNWRVVVIGAVSVALSLVAAGVVLLLADVTVNTMVLAGLVVALVVIVDDAVVAAWGASQTPHQGEGPLKAMPAVIDSILRRRSVAVFAALIVAAAALPITAMEGAAGAFLEPIVLTYLLAVAVAILVGLIVTPALTVVLFVSLPTQVGEPRATVALLQKYAAAAGKWIPKTGRAMVVFGVFVGAGLVTIPFLSRSMEPELLERDLIVNVEAASGTSLQHMSELTAGMVADIGALEDVRNVGAHVGRAIRSDQIVNVNSAEIWLNVDPDADYHRAVDRIETAVSGYPEVVASVQTYSDQRIHAILDQPDDELTVRVYGENTAVREDSAEQIKSLMAGIEGIESPRVDLPIEEPTIEIQVDLQRAQAFGVKPGDVRRQAATLVSGIVVGNLFEDQKVFDVVVWGTPAIRESVNDVRTMPIATPSGDHVPLGELADVRVVPNPTVIEHESVVTYVDVRAQVTGRSIAAAAADMDVALAQVQFPLEHHAEILGGFEEAGAARSRVIAAAVAGLILIYLLLQAAFASWRLATLVFLTVPLAVSGSLIAVALTGGDLTLGSAAGVLAVFALAVRSALLIIRTYQRRARQGEPFGQDLIVEQSAALAVPTVVSALAVAAVVLPLALMGSRAGLELAGPMAVAVLGGLVTTVLFALVVIPTFYLRWGFVAKPATYADDIFSVDLRVESKVGG